MKVRRLPCLILLAGLALSCGRGCTSDHIDAGDTEDADSRGFVFEPEDTKDESGNDVEKDGIERSDAADVRDPSTNHCSVAFASDNEPYVCGSDSSDVHYRPQPNGFAIPDRQDHGGPRTIDQIESFFGEQLPEEAEFWSLANAHEPDDNSNEGFAVPGDDVKLHFGAIHPRDRYGDSTLRVSVLLNYQPVEALYEHFSPSRNVRRDKVVDTHATFPIGGAVELVDITIPAEAFERTGRYDLGLKWGSDGPVHFSGGTDVIRLYYGGCTPPSHPCAERGELETVNKDERAIAKKYFASGYVYPAGEHSNRLPLERITLSEGKRVEVAYSLHASDEFPIVSVVIPFINGKPLDRRRYVQVARKDGSAPPPVVGHRGRMKIDIPEQPGTYEVYLGIWNFPFLEPGFDPGFGIGELPRYRPDRGTNAVTYVVK